MLTMNNGVIEATADAFIIPNKMGCVNNFVFDAEGRKEYFKLLAALNDYEYDENDKLVELWFVETSEGEGVCSNMVDHTFNIKDKDKIWIARLKSPYIPYKLLQYKVEGDDIQLKLPVYAYRYEKGTKLHKVEVDIMINITVTFRQKNYRYREFGAFEDTLLCIA